MEGLMVCSWHKGCNRQAEKNGLCEIHYWHTIWLDNRDKENLGIVRFAQMIVPIWVRDGTPEFHKEVYHSFLSMYNPKLEDKYDRLLAEIAFRGAAKTTASKIILLYICCFGLEKLVIYCSETNSFAVQDTFEVRRELSTNGYIRRYFGIINSKAVRGQDGEWSRDAYLTTTGVYVLARGVGQQVRSALRNSYRPTLAIINDMYSKDSVKTEHSRTEYAKWFFNDMFNAVDDIEGKVFFNGTILHEDTVPVTIERNGDWKLLKYPIMDVDDFHRVLKECPQTDTTVELPPRERIDELQKTCHLYWPERLNLNYILKKYREAYQSSQVAGFYQEYFHIVVPPGEKSFKNIQRVKIVFFKADRRNWIRVQFTEDTEVVYEVNTFLGVDPASATTQSSKFSAITVVAMNQYRQVFVLGYSRGKFGFRDELKPGHKKSVDSDIVIVDTTPVERLGIVDEEIRLVKKYGAIGSCVETVQQQQSVYDEINRIMRPNAAFHRLYGVKPITEKTERDANILVPYFQTGSIFVNYGLSELDNELESFPRGSTIDIIDALAYSVSIATPAEGADYSEIYKRKQDVNIFETEFVVL